MKRYISQNEFITLFKVSRQTVTNWRDGYTKNGVKYPPILNESDWMKDKKGRVWYSAQAIKKIYERTKP